MVAKDYIRTFWYISTASAKLRIEPPLPPNTTFPSRQEQLSAWDACIDEEKGEVEFNDDDGKKGNIENLTIVALKRVISNMANDGVERNVHVSEVCVMGYCNNLRIPNQKKLEVYGFKVTMRSDGEWEASFPGETEPTFLSQDGRVVVYQAPLNGLNERIKTFVKAAFR